MHVSFGVPLSQTGTEEIRDGVALVEFYLTE
jgi:hypothetical protein